MLPREDAAFVNTDELPVLLSGKELPNRHGIMRLVNETVMIRQSSIKNGKIVIPAAGLVIAEKGGEFNGPLNGEPISIFGQQAITVGQTEGYLVKKNFEVVNDGKAVPLGGHGTIALGGSRIRDRYMGVLRGSINFHLPKGFSAWAKKVVLPQSDIHQQGAIPVESIVSGRGLEEGFNTPPKPVFIGNRYDADASSWVSVDSMAENKFFVQEAGCVDIKDFSYTCQKPVFINAATTGHRVKVEDYEIIVVAVDSDAGTAEVAILRDETVVAKKNLGPLTPETYLVKNGIVQNMAVRESLSLQFNDIKVQLNTKYEKHDEIGPNWILNHAGEKIPATEATSTCTFHAGNSVDLVAYTKVQKVKLREPFPGFDGWQANVSYVCPWCHMMIGLVIENSREIVLDTDTKSFEAPNGLFRIVIDEFDGNRIQDWHMEAGEEKTNNLAGFSKGTHIDVMAGKPFQIFDNMRFQWADPGRVKDMMSR